jgi:hypothetical protein
MTMPNALCPMLSKVREEDGLFLVYQCTNSLLVSEGVIEEWNREEKRFPLAFQPNSHVF